MPVVNLTATDGSIVTLDLDDIADNEILSSTTGEVYLITLDGKLVHLNTIVTQLVEAAAANVPIPEAVSLLASETYVSTKSYPKNSVVTVTLADNRVASYWTAEEAAVGTAPPTAPWQPLAIPAPLPPSSVTGGVENLSQSTQPAGGVTVDVSLQKHYYIKQDANKPTTITGYGKGGFAVLTFYAAGSGTSYQPNIVSGAGGTVTLLTAPSLDLNKKGEGKTYIVRSHSATSAVLSQDTNDLPVIVEAAVVSQHPNSVATYEFASASTPLANVITPGTYNFDAATGTFTQVVPMGLSFGSTPAGDTIRTPLFTGRDFEAPWAAVLVMVNAHTFPTGTTLDPFGFAVPAGLGTYTGNLRGRMYLNSSTTDRFVSLRIDEPNAALLGSLTDSGGNFIGTRIDPGRVLNPILISYEGSGLWQIYNLATGATLANVSNGTLTNKRYFGSSATVYPDWNNALALGLNATHSQGGPVGQSATQYKHVQVAFGLPAGGLSNANLKQFHDVAKEAIARIDPTGPQLGTSFY